MARAPFDVDVDATDVTGRELVDIVAHVRQRILDGEHPVWIAVTDPDLGAGLYPGARMDASGGAEGDSWIRRPLRTWVDLADRLSLRLHLGERRDHRLRLGFTPLDPSRGWPRDSTADRREKYGAASGYDDVRKHEDPWFIVDLDEALERAWTTGGPRLLDLGVNDAEELALIHRLRPGWKRTRWVGLDHSVTALDRARRRVPGARFEAVDLDDASALDSLALGRFDLVVAIATLHSPNLDGPALLRRVVQQHLHPGGSVIVGTPNCRYVDGERLHGAKMVNFRQPDLSVLLKTVAFTKRYLNQHGFKVFVTGKDTLLVTGVPERRSPGAAED